MTHSYRYLSKETLISEKRPKKEAQKRNPGTRSRGTKPKKRRYLWQKSSRHKSKEKIISKKRPRKETRKRDLEKRPRKETQKRDVHFKMRIRTSKHQNLQIWRF